TAIVALIGRGVGMGILEHGRVLRGFSSSAGELGHMKLLPDGPKCSCGAYGCLGALIASDAIAAQWKEAGGTEFPTTRDCVDYLTKHDAKDARATAVLDDVIRYLTLGLSNVVNLLNPSMCIIGGWLGSALMSARPDQIEQGTKQTSLVHPAEQVRVTASKQGREAVALGGVLTALEDYVENLDARPSQ